MHDITVLANVSSTYEVFNLTIGHFQTYTQDTVEHLLILGGLYALLSILLYILIVRWNLIGFRCAFKDPERVLLVTAHPDDECMFFGPTLVHLSRLTDCTVYLMCLSRGNERCRKRELYDACRTLGIDDANVTVHQHDQMPDKMDVSWPVEVLAALILNHVEAYSISTLVTFDRHGVSYHRNHCSIYYAIAHLRLEKKLPDYCTVYVLETVNLMRKYWLLLDIPISFLLSRTRFLVDCTDRGRVQAAMKKHRSQMVWFRRLYIAFSRYMLINSLQEMNLSDIELDLAVED